MNRKFRSFGSIGKFKTFANANETRFQLFTLIKLGLHAKT